MVLSTMIQRVVCFIGLLLLYSKTPTAFSLLATSSSVDCDFEINMCGWIIGRNFSSPVGSHLYWNLCPHLPSSNDFKDTCDNNVGFKYADPFARHDTRGSSETDLPLDFHRHGGFVLRSSNQNVEPPYSTQYSTFYTSYILSVDVPVFFLYRCLRYSFSLRGQSTFVVSYLITEEKSDVILKEYQANWMGKVKEGWIVGNGSVNLPLKPTFRIMFRVWFRYSGNNAINVDNVRITEGLCNASCPHDEYRCRSGECLSPSLVCDSRNDCLDGSDEDACDLVSEENPVQLNSSEHEILNTTSVCSECPKNATCISFCPTSCNCNGTAFLCKTYFSLAYSFLVRLSEVTCNILDVSELGRGIFQFEIFSSLISTLNITDDVQIENLIIKNSNVDSIQIPHQAVNHVQFTNIKVNSLSFVTSFMFLHVMGNIPSFSASAFLYMPYVKFEGNDLSSATVIYEMWNRALLSSNNSHNKAVLRNCNIQNTYTTNYIKSSFIDLSHNKLKSFTVSDRTEILLIRNNLLDTVVRPYAVTFNTSLKTLDMSFNKIIMLGQGDFTYFFNLLYIDLKSNNISWMHDEIFLELTNLRYLDLSNNLIQTIKQTHFINLESLQYLYLQKNLLSSIDLESFYSLKNLLVLDMSNNKLTSLKGMYFRNLKELRYLYLQNNKFQVSEGMFDGLSSLQVMQVDFFSLCCAKPRNVYDIVCIAPGNEISSCSNLIAVPILNVGIWYIALFAAFGNLVVFCYKLVYQKRQSAQAHFIFTTNLNWADFIMGIYLFIIAIANLVYNGRYGLEDFAWRHSYYCTFAGILATVSSETSALLVFLITMDRLIAIKFPFSGRGFTKNGAIFLSLCSWFVALFLALLPIVPMQSNYFDGYYARSGVCISLPLSVVKKSGWQYSMAVFIGLNFMLFFGILIGQIIIFAEVIKVGSNLVSSRKKQREISLTKSLAAIVLTDMCCWIPIGTIGLLTFFGIDVSNEVYDWIIVIVLPINSALNPVIYNFIAFMRHKRRADLSESNNLKQECAVLKRKLEVLQSMNKGCSCQRKVESVKKEQHSNTEVVDTGSGMETYNHTNGMAVTVIRMDTRL